MFIFLMDQINSLCVIYIPFQFVLIKDLYFFICCRYVAQHVTVLYMCYLYIRIKKVLHHSYCILCIQNLQSVQLCQNVKKCVKQYRHLAWLCGKKIHNFLTSLDDYFGNFPYHIIANFISNC